MTDDLERRLGHARTEEPTLDLAGLRERLSARAAAAGVLDVAYGEHDSPLGPLRVFVTDRGVVRIGFPAESLESQLDELARKVSPRVLRAPDRTDAVRRELDEYFVGARRIFDVRVDWRLTSGFAERVLEATARIPFGEVSSYRQMAAAAGSPHAYRAAGNALGSNPVPIVVPCHRVLHASGGLGGYAGGLESKRYLLRLEGNLGT